jgi:hypothetical protein
MPAASKPGPHILMELFSFRSPLSFLLLFFFFLPPLSLDDDDDDEDEGIPDVFAAAAAAAAAVSFAASCTNLTLRSPRD